MDSLLNELSDIIKNILEDLLNNEGKGGYFLTEKDCKLLLGNTDSEGETFFPYHGDFPESSHSYEQGYVPYPLYHWTAVLLYEWIFNGTCPITTSKEFDLLDERYSENNKFEMCQKAEPVIQQIRDKWKTMSLSSKSSHVSELLSTLGKRGMLYLLGVRHTVGSVETFPPPMSSLWHSFNLKHNKKSKLTVGARALSKHCHRDVSSSWWGTCKGSEEAKNDHANNVLKRILSSSAWINIHMLPHEVLVLEVRHSEGYGARWSADGSQFRGFLEPQMEEGHSCKWRH